MKIVSFSWILVLSLTQILIQWWCSLFLLLNRNTIFMANLFRKLKIVCWSWNLELRLTRICKSRYWFSFYSFLNWKYPFWVILVEKFKIVSLSWNLVPELFRIYKIRWWCSFFCFRPFFANFVQKIHLAFWCYLINLPAVY